MKTLFILPLLLSGLNTQRAENPNYQDYSKNIQIGTTNQYTEQYQQNYDVITRETSIYYNDSLITTYGTLVQQRLTETNNTTNTLLRNKNSPTSFHSTATIIYLPISTDKYLNNMQLRWRYWYDLGTSNSLQQIRWFISQNQDFDDYIQAKLEQTEDVNWCYNVKEDILNGQVTYQYETNYWTNYGLANSYNTTTQTFNLIPGYNYILLYIEPYTDSTGSQYATYQTTFGGGIFNLTYIPTGNTEETQSIKLSGQVYIGQVVVSDPVDIPGMMFDILTMPFMFISYAFNLTIFPGTPYMVNISNLLLTIIGIIIFGWILKKVVLKS